MEALSLGGVPTVLFIGIPDAELLARFADCRAIGLAGTSRSETPEWMETHLPAGLRVAEVAWRCCLPLQGLLDLRFQPGSRQHRPGHRDRPAGLRPEAPCRRGRGAAAQALHRLRQSVRWLPGRDLSYRPPPGDEPASGDADGRGGPARPSLPPDERRVAALIDLAALARGRMPRPAYRRRGGSRGNRAARRGRPRNAGGLLASSSGGWRTPRRRLSSSAPPASNMRCCQTWIENGLVRARLPSRRSDPVDQHGGRLRQRLADDRKPDRLSPRATASTASRSIRSRCLGGSEDTW